MQTSGGGIFTLRVSGAVFEFESFDDVLNLRIDIATITLTPIFDVLHPIDRPHSW